MHHSLRELGAALSATVVGDDTITVTGAAEPQLASPAQIAIATSPAYVKRLPDGAAVAALLADGTDWQALGLKGAILVKRPRYAMAQMSVRMDHRWRQGGGVTCIPQP
ncbi:MAG: LpxD N-terminal domain-containing protein [Pseudomonadota bacterium]